MDAYFYSENFAFNSEEQMAMDEWMLIQTGRLNAFGFRVYRMQGTCTIGRNQRVAEIKGRIQETTDLVRRPTGGGTVFHSDDLIYALTIPNSHDLYDLKLSTSIVKSIWSLTPCFDIFPSVPNSMMDALNNCLIFVLMRQTDLTS